MAEILLDGVETISRVFEINSYFAPVTLVGEGIAGGVNVNVKFTPVDRTDGERIEGTAFTLFQGGGALALTDVNNIVTFYGPGVFSVEATQAGPIVYLSRGENP